MEPSWHQNRIQKRSYVEIAGKPKNTIFPMECDDFSRFGDRFSEGKSDKNRLKNAIQDGMPQFRSLLIRKSGPRRPQDVPRRPRRPQKTPHPPPRQPQDASRRGQDASQDAPRTPQDVPKTPQDAPRKPQDTSKTPR